MAIMNQGMFLLSYYLLTIQWCSMQAIQNGQRFTTGGPIIAISFVLMAEVLNKMLERATEVGLFRGLEIGRHTVITSAICGWHISFL